MTITRDNPRFEDRTVGEIAADLPGSTAIFRSNRIDFCCGGGISLAEAAAKRGVPLDGLVKTLSALLDAPARAPDETPALIDHILTRYHATHRAELPELILLARKVEAVHRDNPEVPAGLAETLQSAEVDLEDHMMKEEQILFPLMRNGYQGSVFGPITVMRHEHDQHGEMIHRLEELTDAFTPPAGACRSWQALYAGVEKLVDDLQEHIHLENSVLFPRFET